MVRIFKPLDLKLWLIPNSCKFPQNKKIEFQPVVTAYTVSFGETLF